MVNNVFLYLCQIKFTDLFFLDQETKNISLALYRYICRTIVGTENHVKKNETDH